MIKIKGKLWLTREEWKRSIGPIWRGGVIGFIIGVLPGAGARSHRSCPIRPRSGSRSIPRNSAKARSKAWRTESANNSDTAGAMVPLLTLGVPGGGATAVLLGAFIMYGIQPGPLLSRIDPISCGV